MMTTKSLSPRGPFAWNTGKKSSRWRIVAWVMLTATFAIAIILVSIHHMMKHEVTVKAQAEIDQELKEFKTFAQKGKNPETSEAFDTVSQMIEVYISRQHAGPTEQQIGLADNKVLVLQKAPGHPSTVDYQLHLDQEVIHAISAATEATGVEETPAGPIHWGRVDVRIGDAGGQEGQFLVVEYMQPAFDNVHKATGTMIGIATLALLLALLIAWLVAGEILKPIRELHTVAEEITDKNFRGRVPVRGNDDVAAMALQFNQMLDRLEESHRTQREFLDDVSHELRTPITIVRGHLELMERLTPDQENTLDLVDDELERMGRIVTDLLLLAKSEHTDFILSQECDVAELMISLDSKIQAFSNHRWVMTDIADGTAWLDQQRITQALLQLCSNAAQYSPAASIVELGSNFEQGQAGETVNFWVRDHGPGINPETASSIFDRFKRNKAKNPAIAQNHSVGVGLGLAIVRTIAEGHRGSAWVAQPDSGPGTIFGITLPRYPHTMPSPQDPPQESEPSS